MAPSAHNTQPWRFVSVSDGRILVRWDPARALPVSDPTNRDLYLSLGAAIESARLRSAAAGAPLVFISAPDRVNRTVGTLAPAQDPVDPADLDLEQFLNRRQTARTPHLPNPVPRDALASLQEEALKFGCRLHAVVERPHVRRLAVLARRATAAQFADPAVHGELWQWLRLQPHDPAYARDGLTADCLNVRGAALAVARFAMAPGTMRWLVRLRLHHLLAIDTQRLVEQSASMCLLTAPSAGQADLLDAGRALLRVWLIAARAGLSAHPVSALLDCAATVGPVAAVFGAAGATPAAVFRLGECPPVARAPRLPANELMEVEWHPGS